MEAHVRVRPRSRGRDRRHLAAVPVERRPREDRAGEDGVVAQPAAPVEHRDPVATACGPGEHVREREEHVVRGEVVPGDRLARSCLVVDAERPRALECRDPLGPLCEVGVGDGALVPAARRPAPALGERLELGLRGLDHGLGRRVSDRRREEPQPPQQALHADHDDRRRQRLDEPSEGDVLRHGRRPPGPRSPVRPHRR